MNIDNKNKIRNISKVSFLNQINKNKVEKSKKDLQASFLSVRDILQMQQLLQVFQQHSCAKMLHPKFKKFNTILIMLETCMI